MSISSLPVGYSAVAYQDGFLLIHDDMQIGWIHLSIEAAIAKAYEHIEFTAMNQARMAELNFDWYESHDSITKECTLPYINDDNSCEIVVYFEGHEYAGKHHDIARFKAAGFDEAISLDMAFLYR